MPFDDADEKFARMRGMRWRMGGLIAAVVLSLGGLSGCETPKSTCKKWKRAIERMYFRCEMPVRIQLVDSSGMPRGCGDVSELKHPEEIFDECIPWSKEVACEDVPDPSSLPTYCKSSRHFRYVEVR